MVLVQMLLSLYNSDGQRVPHTLFAELRDELTEHFGGVTAFTRAPAQGTWKEHTGEVDRDEVVMCEVMVDPLKRAWWADYRKKLERRFGQQELMMRALQTERL